MFSISEIDIALILITFQYAINMDIVIVWHFFDKFFKS